MFETYSFSDINHCRIFLKKLEEACVLPKVKYGIPYGYTVKYNSLGDVYCTVHDPYISKTKVDKLHAEAQEEVWKKEERRWLLQ